MEEKNLWVVRPRIKPASKLRLFCFAYAGVGPSAFRGWADALDSNVEACFVHLPGREGRLRERPYTSMDELIPPLAGSLIPLLDKTPLFYGHSLGAKIAFETCRELRRRGEIQPAHLFTGACPAPHIERQHALMHRLGDDEFITEIHKRYGGIPLEVLRDPEILSLLLPGMRADVTLLETYKYVPESPLACPVTAFGGLQDRMVTRESIEEWRHATSGSFRMMALTGDHFFTQTAKAALIDAISGESKWIGAAPLP